MPKFPLSIGLLGSVLALTLVIDLNAAGQAPSGTASNAPTSNSDTPGEHQVDREQSQEESTETLKVNVEVVQLFFNVKDKHGALIPNLNKDNFDVAEDGKAQTIKYFKAETDLPLTLGILIDTSGSQ